MKEKMRAARGDKSPNGRLRQDKKSPNGRQRRDDESSPKPKPSTRDESPNGRQQRDDKSRKPKPSIRDKSQDESRGPVAELNDKTRDGIVPRHGIVPRNGVPTRDGVVPRDGVVTRDGIVPRNSVVPQDGIVPRDNGSRARDESQFKPKLTKPAVRNVQRNDKTRVSDGGLPEDRARDKSKDEPTFPRRGNIRNEQSKKVYEQKKKDPAFKEKKKDSNSRYRASQKNNPTFTSNKKASNSDRYGDLGAPRILAPALSRQSSDYLTEVDRGLASRRDAPPPPIDPPLPRKNKAEQPVSLIKNMKPPETEQFLKGPVTYTGHAYDRMHLRVFSQQDVEAALAYGKWTSDKSSDDKDDYKVFHQRFVICVKKYNQTYLIKTVWKKSNLPGSRRRAINNYLGQTGVSIPALLAAFDGLDSNVTSNPLPIDFSVVPSQKDLKDIEDIEGVEVIGNPERWVSEASKVHFLGEKMSAMDALQSFNLDEARKVKRFWIELYKALDALDQHFLVDFLVDEYGFRTWAPEGLAGLEKKVVLAAIRTLPPSDGAFKPFPGDDIRTMLHDTEKYLDCFGRCKAVMRRLLREKYHSVADQNDAAIARLSQFYADGKAVMKRITTYRGQVELQMDRWGNPRNDWLVTQVPLLQQFVETANSAFRDAR